MTEIKTMSIDETVEKLRNMGMRINPLKLRSGLAQGVYPFGDVVMMDKQLSFTIYSRLFDLWVAAERATVEQQATSVQA